MIDTVKTQSAVEADLQASERTYRVPLDFLELDLNPNGRGKTPVLEITVEARTRVLRKAVCVWEERPAGGEG